MVEIYSDIKEEVRLFAQNAWRVSLTMNSPKESAEFLTNCLVLAEQEYTEEEINFIKFYFQTQMEMVKHD